jgi:hypothetical protein
MAKKKKCVKLSSLRREAPVPTDAEEQIDPIGDVDRILCGINSKFVFPTVP